MQVRGCYTQEGSKGERVKGLNQNKLQVNPINILIVCKANKVITCSSFSTTSLCPASSQNSLASLRHNKANKLDCYPTALNRVGINNIWVMYKYPLILNSWLFCTVKKTCHNSNILYLNMIGFKAQSFWGCVKIIITWNYIKIGLTLLTKHNYHGKNLKNVQ